MESAPLLSPRAHQDVEPQEISVSHHVTRQEWDGLIRQFRDLSASNRSSLVSPRSGTYYPPFHPSRTSQRGGYQGRGSHHSQNTNFIPQPVSPSYGGSQPGISISAPTPVIEVLAALNQLLSIHLPSNNVSKEDGVLMLMNLCGVLRDRRDEQLYSKYSQFVVNLMSKYQLLFTSSNMEDLVSFFLATMKPPASENIVLDQLRALSYILYENGNKIPSHQIQSLLDFLTQLSSSPNREIQRLSINCIGNLCVKSGNQLRNYYRSIYSLLYANFETAAQQVQQSPALCKNLSSVLRSLQYVIIEGKSVHEGDLKHLVNLLKKLVFIGTPLFPVDTETQELTISLKSEEIDTHESDSTVDRHYTWKVRLHALTCVAAIAKSSPKTFYPYWSVFIPSSPHPLNPSLFSVILHDPVSRVRGVGASTLSSILEPSKNYLLVANDSSKTGSFIPISHTVGAMIREIHNGLMAAMDSESHVPTLNQIIKCTTVLVNSTPYDRLSAGLLTGVVSRLLKLVMHRDFSIAVHALSCLSACMSTRVPLPEMSALLTSKSGPASENMMEQLNSLVQQLKGKERTQPDYPSSVRLELYQVFCAIIRTYFSTARHYWKATGDLMLEGLKDKEEKHANDGDSTRLGALKVVEEYTKAAVEHETAISCVFLWNELLEDTNFTGCFQDPSHLIRSTICGCFSNLNAEIFDALSTEKQNMCLHLALEMTQDLAPVVRTAAARTIGIYVLFPSLYQDAVFLVDSADTILSLMVNERNLNVRVKASWSIGNWCDAVVKSAEISEQIMEELPTATLFKIAECSIRGLTDNDKIRSNAVRALGNFCRFASPSMLETASLLSRSVAGLVNCLNTGSVKVQWNASYAIGNLFRNSYIQKKLDSAHWSNSVFSSLISIIRNGKNFKSRINATLALSLLPLRSYYPSVAFIHIWKTLDEALETIDEMTTDFAEFKYQDTFRIQLISTLSHIVILSNDVDFKQLSTEHLDIKMPSLFQTFEKHKDKLQEIAQEEVSTAMAKLIPFINSNVPASR
eukprot:TRINITY_DN6139_c0_g1_i1.p1 TRINITY_DN6139_c0_g1~~TRINITY_DN6139_c0_g1_i1.p1  ORF type:complete len:1037 (+),score=195.16 TRINITY_DN6139_c0_g1_i1:31-3111(+)